jgi:hypothetical protein
MGMGCWDTRMGCMALCRLRTKDKLGTEKKLKVTTLQIIWIHIQTRWEGIIDAW